MTEEPKVVSEDRGWSIRLFSHPVMVMIAWVATVLSLILAIYFFYVSARKRDLISYVNPAKAVVVKTGEASRLRVLYGDQELTSDVTAAQVAIWNAGNDSIRPENVLESIIIKTSPSVPILEASVRKTSRRVINFSLDRSHLSQGVLGVS